MERYKLYTEIPDELLGAFYINIRKNIEKGIKTKLMMNEAKLIENEAKKRNIPLSELKEIGVCFINNEQELVNKS